MLALCFRFSGGQLGTEMDGKVQEGVGKSECVLKLKSCLINV